MKKSISISLTAVIAAIILVMLFASSVTALYVRADDRASEASDTVTVSGSSSVFVTPDKAEITLSIETKDKTAAAAQKTNTEEVKKVIDKLKELGLEEKSITTSSYNIYQDYDYENDKPSDYVVSTGLTIKDIDVADTGTVLSDCVEAGANNVQNVSYRCSTYDDEYEKALTDAVAAAKKKADALAKAAGKSVGDVSTIIEGYQDTSARYTESKNFAASAVAEEAAYDMSVDIMPGESEIRANVTVTWYLK